MKRDNEETFRSQCPCFDCNNDQLIKWHHYGCPFFSDLYISNTGMLRCEFCGMNSEFFQCKFDC